MKTELKKIGNKINSYLVIKLNLPNIFALFIIFFINTI